MKIFIGNDLYEFEVTDISVGHSMLDEKVEISLSGSGILLKKNAKADTAGNQIFLEEGL